MDEDVHGHVFNSGLQALAANLLPEPDCRVGDIASLQKTLNDWMRSPLLSQYWLFTNLVILSQLTGEGWNS